MATIIHKRYVEEQPFSRGARWFIYVKCKKNVILSDTSFMWGRVTCKECLKNK